MPNADIFMALCKIYDCKNILEMFSFINADYSIPTDEEWDIIEKYRFISTNSPDGASVVDTVLDREYAIAGKLKEQNEKIIELTEIPRYVKEDSTYVNAAHAIEGASEEDKQFDEDIMTGEDF